MSKVGAAADMAWMLHDSAALSSGYEVEDTEAFAMRSLRVMGGIMNVDSMELMDEIDVPEEEDDEEEDEEAALEAEFDEYEREAEIARLKKELEEKEL